MNIGEYDYEPIPGLPAYLPEGESLLWQGSPAWRPLARRALRVVPISLYFVLLALWRGSVVLMDTYQWLPALRAASLLLLLGALAVGVLCLLAWLAARATMYSITSARIVIRHGIALPMSLNLPFARIHGVSLSTHADGTGEVALSMVKGERVGYFLTWPHVRPGHFLQPQPTLRAIPDAAHAAAVLSRALLASGAVPAQATAEVGHGQGLGVPPSSAAA